ncbi:Putative NAD(P)H nitroreductase [Pontiella desulfatans]|uniref:NAD(P)H nitroreductase n=1 Tax=Pontiella desulfatans TaxID=2750659 RepID=A0A6C2UBD5_PONDE|nr:nitroreductase family protein [Pontiella desulfatans]VGO17482.1 Putative NAD(P)H nitroreductase [Pontiella desulfatans]
MEKEPFINLVKHRTSCRSYEAKPVPREHLELMLEAARLAPSACNKQPWRFAVVQDAGTRMRLVKESLRVGIEMKWAANAGAIIAIGVRSKGLVHKVGTRITGVEYPQIDLGIAGEHLVLQAEELGLGTCWIGWIKQKAVRRIVGWSKDVAPMGLITVGWPAGERKTRPRLPLDEIVKWI